MEILPIGPVLFIDTAGIDDEGALGEMRMQKTRQVFDRTDLGLIIAASGNWGPFEEGILRELRERKIPAIAVFNKADLAQPPATLREELGRTKVVCVETGLAGIFLSRSSRRMPSRTGPSCPTPAMIRPRSVRSKTWRVFCIRVPPRAPSSWIPR